MTDPYTNYLQQVLPIIPRFVHEGILGRYPDVRLTPAPGFTPLAGCRVVMLVGLTGTGKSTTLAALREIAPWPYVTDIPTRRELADLIVIPAAQHHRGEAIDPPTDREARFDYTRIFAAEVAPGGTAQAFTWLHYAHPNRLVLSEGVRGPNEIAYALAHTRWRIAELWIDPVLRLQRLTNRNDTFDRVTNPDTEDLAFLSPEQAATVRELLASGDISPAAVTTARAEARNYGGTPYDAANTTPNYRCFVTDTYTPEQVAAQLAAWIGDDEGEA